jgi:hypothetical protein
MSFTNIVLAHEPDAAWIIALWKAIHGGDPSPEQVAASVVAVMAPYLGGSTAAFSAQQLAAGFETLGVTVTQPPVEELLETGQPVQFRQYCFNFQGKTICVTLQLPKVAIQTA